LEEYPGGKLLYQTAGYISYPRVSPRGDKVAFMAHQMRSDNRGWVVIADRSGRTNALSGEWVSEEGLVWEPTGHEVWFGASKVGLDRWDLRALSVSGKERRLAGLPASCIPCEVDATGRMLLSRFVSTGETFQGAGSKTTNLYLPGAGNVFGLSRDGKQYLFDYEGYGSDPSYTTYLGKSDGSPSIQLGEGLPLCLAPDDQWLLVLRYNPSRLVLLPTGMGQSRTLDLQGIEPSGAAWLPDGKRILVAGRRGSEATRIFVQSLAGGSPQAVTPPGMGWPFFTGAVSPAGDKFVVVNTNQVPMVFFINGSGAKPIPGFTDQDFVIGWCDDNESAFVMTGRDVWPVRIHRVRMDSGLRSAEPVITLQLPDMAGIVLSPFVLITPDAQHYVFGVPRNLCDLFLLEGLK
jgi:hypothetical protein